MRRLAVPSHVFLVTEGEYVVFLDLKRDRYWAAPRQATAGLARRVCGWPAPPPEGGGEPDADADPGTIETLLARGLLCDAQAAMARHEGADDAPAIVPPQSELALATARDSAERKIALSFFLAAATAATVLKCWGLQAAVDRTRQRHQMRTTHPAPPGVEAAAALVRSYESLRPLLFSARDACLFNSLVLIEFLARHGCYPRWVFGVRARPFAAHCWVQQDDVVFNDSVEHVTRYAPIMAV